MTSQEWKCFLNDVTSSKTGQLPWPVAVRRQGDCCESQGRALAAAGAYGITSKKAVTVAPDGYWAGTGTWSNLGAWRDLAARGPR
eukprot:5364454-Prymnesium_polylepis.1